MKGFDAARHFETDPSLVANPSTRLRLSTLAAMKPQEVPEEEVETLGKLREGRYREYAERLEREKKLSLVSQELQLQRNLMVAPLFAGADDAGEGEARSDKERQRGPSCGLQVAP